jgi:hypothetical protein
MTFSTFGFCSGLNLRNPAAIDTKEKSAVVNCGRHISYKISPKLFFYGPAFLFPFVVPCVALFKCGNYIELSEAVSNDTEFQYADKAFRAFVLFI